MHPSGHFVHCPRCGEEGEDAPANSAFHCLHCDFQYFFNPAVAAAAFLRRKDGKLLFIQRAKDPAKGKLALPGGFIDANETAEVAVRREIKEEIGIDVSNFQFLCSHPNAYHYRGITYPVLDFFFYAALDEAKIKADPTEVSEVLYLELSEVSETDIAFPSVSAAFLALKKKLDGDD